LGLDPLAKGSVILSESLVISSTVSQLIQKKSKQKLQIINLEEYFIGFLIMTPLLSKSLINLAVSLATKPFRDIQK